MEVNSCLSISQGKYQAADSLYLSNTLFSLEPHRYKISQDFPVAWGKEWNKFMFELQFLVKWKIYLVGD